MSVQYWPGGPKEEQYGEVGVKLLEERRYASFVQRTFRVRRGEERERELTHLQFTEWPCYSSPNSGALLTFRQRVSELVGNSQLTGPAVVHCHDGGGRSGVYVMLDANLNLIQSSAQHQHSLTLRLDRLQLECVGVQHSGRSVDLILTELQLLQERNN